MTSFEESGVLEPTLAARSEQLFELMLRRSTRQQVRRECRDDLVRLHLPLVEHCARRFRNRGEPLDDLAQVGTIGLLKAIDRFDPERGVQFSTYAMPTIVGEIKRHFRDKGWAIRVPRRLQELRMQVAAETATLSQSLGRAPTPREIASSLDVDLDDVREALETVNAYHALSLDSASGPEDHPLAGTIGVEDEGLEAVELRASLRPLLAALPEREKQILMLRFFQNKTQAEIAGALGISQMHVSRLLTKTLARLRSGMNGTP